MLTLSKLTDDAMLHVLENISPEDAAELVAAGVDSMDSFLEGRDKSVISGCVLKDMIEPVAIYGCVPHPAQPETGIPWMVATPKFRKHKRDGMALSRQVVGLMQERFTYLQNLVHIEHTTAIRWLSWCGFNVNFMKPMGTNNAFFHFDWSKTDV